MDPHPSAMARVSINGPLHSLEGVIAGFETIELGFAHLHRIAAEYLGS
jgi:hypothetical protein